MSVHRRPTLRCVIDDLEIALPPVSTPLAKAVGAVERADAKLVAEFCADEGPAEQGRRVTTASAAVGRPVFRRRRSDVRGITWYEHDPSAKLPDAEIVPASIEWMMIVGARSDDEIYDDAARVARRGELLPSNDDYLRCHLEHVALIGHVLRDAVDELLRKARAAPNEPMGARFLWGVPARMLVMFEPSIEEIYLAFPRSSGDMADRITHALIGLIEQQGDVTSEEILVPESMPPWVPPGWRCHHFMRDRPA